MEILRKFNIVEFLMTTAKMVGDYSPASVKREFSRAILYADARGSKEKVVTEVDGPETWKGVEDIVENWTERKRAVRVDIDIRYVKARDDELNISSESETEEVEDAILPVTKKRKVNNHVISNIYVYAK
jgi:hypothetical protein